MNFEFNLKNYKEWAADNVEGKAPELNIEDIVLKDAEVPSVNTMTVEQWSEVPGIGPTLAQRLVESGPYDSIEGIRAVKGISEKVFNSVKSLLTS